MIGTVPKLSAWCLIQLRLQNSYEVNNRLHSRKAYSVLLSLYFAVCLYYPLSDGKPIIHWQAYNPLASLHSSRSLPAEKHHRKTKKKKTSTLDNQIVHRIQYWSDKHELSDCTSEVKELTR